MSDTKYGITAQGIDQHNKESKKEKPFDRAEYMAQAYPLLGMPKEQYDKLTKSGMFWELYPDATGDYTIDCLDL